MEPETGAAGEPRLDPTPTPNGDAARRRVLDVTSRLTDGPVGEALSDTQRDDTTGPPHEDSRTATAWRERGVDRGPDAPAAVRPPRFLGEYELLAEVARGGMGIVYRALQVHLRRTVALKLIRDPALASYAELRRFR